MGFSNTKTFLSTIIFSVHILQEKSDLGPHCLLLYLVNQASKYM